MSSRTVSSGFEDHVTFNTLHGDFTGHLVSSNFRSGVGELPVSSFEPLGS